MSIECILDAKQEDVRAIGVSISENYQPPTILWIEKDIDTFLRDRNRSDLIRNLDYDRQKDICRIISKQVCGLDCYIDAFYELGIEADYSIKKIDKEMIHTCASYSYGKGAFLIIGGPNHKDLAGKIEVSPQEFMKLKRFVPVTRSVSYDSFKNHDSVIDEASLPFVDVLSNDYYKMEYFGYFVLNESVPLEEACKGIKLQFKKVGEKMDMLAKEKIAHEVPINACPFTKQGCPHITNDAFFFEPREIVGLAVDKIGAKRKIAHKLKDEWRRYFERKWRN